MIRKILIILVALCFLSTCIWDDWTVKHTVLEVTFQTAHVVDWWQTRYIVDDPYMVEGNPILGEHPSPEIIATFFISTAILHFLVSILVPDEYRTVWQGVTLGGQTGTIWWNYKSGVKLKPWWE